MGRKLLSCDLDGTLLFRGEDNTIQARPDDLEAIDRFRAAGNLLVVNSGRNLSWLLPVVPCAWDYLVFSSGAGVYAPDGTILSLREIDHEAIAHTLHNAPFRPEISFEGLDAVYALNRQRDHSEPVVDVTSFSELADVPLTGFGYHFGDGGQDQARAFEAWLDEHGHPRLSYARNLTNMDIVAKGVNKGEALGDLAARLGVAHEDVYAIGDAANDLDMLAAAGHAATFTTSPELHARAEHVVGSVAELIARVLRP